MLVYMLSSMGYTHFAKNASENFTFCLEIRIYFKFRLILLKIVCYYVIVFKTASVFVLDISCKFSKLQYNSLAFVAGFKKATDEGSLPKIAQYSPSFLPLNVFTASKGSKNLYIFFWGGGGEPEKAVYRLL